MDRALRGYDHAPASCPIKFNDEEAELLQRAHAASGVAGLSSHIKQVYFDALKLNVGVLAGDPRRPRPHRRSAWSGCATSDAGKTGRRHACWASLCGLYVMVRKSVGESIRAQADQVLDVSAIETLPEGPLMFVNHRTPDNTLRSWLALGVFAADHCRLDRRMWRCTTGCPHPCSRSGLWYAAKETPFMPALWIGPAVGLRPGHR